jgi:hypothetical protein
MKRGCPVAIDGLDADSWTLVLSFFSFSDAGRYEAVSRGAKEHLAEAGTFQALVLAHFPVLRGVRSEFKVDWKARYQRLKGMRLRAPVAPPSDVRERYTFRMQVEFLRFGRVDATREEIAQVWAEARLVTVPVNGVSSNPAVSFVARLPEPVRWDDDSVVELSVTKTLVAVRRADGAVATLAVADGDLDQATFDGGESEEWKEGERALCQGSWYSFVTPTTQPLLFQGLLKGNHTPPESDFTVREIKNAAGEVQSYEFLSASMTLAWDPCEDERHVDMEDLGAVLDILRWS